MLSRIVPMITLPLIVSSLGCSKEPAPAPTPAKKEVRASVAMGEPDIVGARIAAREAVSETKSPPPPARTLLEQEALPKESSDQTDYKADGARYLTEKRPLEAVGALRIALSSDTSGEVWQMLGEAYLMAGDEQRGVPCLEEAVARDPASVAARKALVKHYLAKEDGARARIHAEELVRQRPEEAAARQMLGRAFMQEKMWKEAIASFEIVAQHQPDNIFAHNNIGFSALQIGALELAREHLERCLSLEPQQGYMLNNLGVTYERLGRQAEAHAAFSRAAELSPRYMQAKLNRDRLHPGLSQDERIVSAESLLRLREPEVVDGVVPPTATYEEGGDLVREAIDAATGGSARLAPADGEPR
jgi:tetratricopeptide (TPR) repeat protein